MRNTGKIHARWTDRSSQPHAVRERFALRKTKSQQQQQQQPQAVCANIFFIFFVCRKKRSTSSYYSTAVNWLKLRNCRREKIEAGGSGTRRLYSNRGERVNEWGPQNVASQRKEAMAKPVPVSLGTSLASFFFFSIGFPRSIIRRSFVTSVLHLPPAAVYTPGSPSPHNRSFVVRFHSDDGGQYRIPCSFSSSSPSCRPSSPRRSFVVKFHSDGGQCFSLALSCVCVDLPILCTWDSAIVIFSQNFHRQFLWRILDLWSEFSSMELHMRSICLWEKTNNARE